VVIDAHDEQRDPAQKDGYSDYEKGWRNNDVETPAALSAADRQGIRQVAAFSKAVENSVHTLSSLSLLLFFTGSDAQEYDVNKCIGTQCQPNAKEHSKVGCLNTDKICGLRS
jgi:hypothetical protein